MRYWRPFTEEAVERLLRRGCDAFLHLPLYPQESRATTGSCGREVRRVLAARAPGAPLREVRSWHLDAGYVAAVRSTVEEGLAAVRAQGGTDVHVLFSAHGLPESFQRRGDPYVDEVRATRDAVARGLAVPTHLSFQSRVGPVAWVKPWTDEMVVDLARQAVRSLVVVPLGFVSDHFETLFEIDCLYVPLAKEKGMTHVVRAPSLNDRPDFLAALAAIALGAAS
jgi:ferrochelatase